MTSEKLKEARRELQRLRSRFQHETITKHKNTLKCRIERQKQLIEQMGRGNG